MSNGQQITVVETASGQTSGWTRDSKGRVCLEYVRKFVAQAPIGSTSEDVRAAEGIPRLGETFTTQYGDLNFEAVAYAVEVTPDRESPGIWHVTVRYSTCKREDGQDENPLLQPAEISGSFDSFKRPLWIDANGKPVVNSAGEPFTEPVMVDDSRPVLRIRKNFPSINPGVWMAAKDAVNDSPFLGFPAGYLKIRNISWETRMWKGMPYVTVTVDMHAAGHEGWDPIKVLDRGFTEIIDGKRELIKDKNGHPVSQAQMLNGQGRVGGPYFLTFSAYRKINFYGLGLF